MSCDDIWSNIDNYLSSPYNYLGLKNEFQSNLIDEIPDQFNHFSFDNSVEYEREVYKSEKIIMNHEKIESNEIENCGFNKFEINQSYGKSFNHEFDDENELGFFATKETENEKELNELEISEEDKCKFLFETNGEIGNSNSFEKVFDIKKIDKETKAKEQEKQKLIESSKLIATKRQMKDDAVLKKAKVRFFKWLRRYLIKIVPNEELTNPEFGKLTQEFIANVNYKNMRDTMDTKLIDIYQNHSENEYDYITILNLIQMNENNELRILINQKIEDLYEFYLKHQFKYDFEKIKTKYKNYDYLKRVWDISNDLINFIHEKKAYEKRKPKLSKEQKLDEIENNKEILEEKTIIDLIINNEKTFKNLNLKDELMKRKRKY